MYTQCPHCASLFAIDAAQLAQAAGRVQCGACEREFDALAHLRRALDTEVELPRLDPQTSSLQLDLFERPLAEPAQPRFVRHAPVALRANRRWWSAVAVLGLLLSAQIAFVQRDEWALQPTWRPWYEQVCAALGCRLPAWREPQRLSLVAREIGPHPSTAAALLVTASLRNDAAFAQPLPVLELSLSDLDGQIVALRRFQPTEYLGADADALLAPGQLASARLEIADPGKSALAFAFEFR